MKLVKLLLVVGTAFQISAAFAEDPCPKKYWVPQNTDMSEFEKTPINKIDLELAADLVTNPTYRSNIIQQNNDCGYIAWTESRRLEGLLDLYESTFDVKYLERFIKRADAVYKLNDIFTQKKDEIRKKVVFGWSSVKYTAGGERHVHGVQAGILSEIYARFARTVWENNLTVYDSKAQDYYSIAARTLNAVLDDWDAKLGFFRFQRNAHPSMNIYPYNQGLAIGSAYVEFYRIAMIKGDDKQAEKMENQIIQIGSYLKKTIKYDEKNDRLLWNYAPGSYIEDMSHASMDMNFILKAHEMKLLWDKKDMTRFANTLVQAYNPKTNQFGRYMDGKQLEGYTNWYSLTCLMVTDFSRFRADKTLIEICEKATKAIITNSNVIKNLDIQYFGMLLNGLPKLKKAKTL